MQELVQYGDDQSSELNNGHTEGIFETNTPSQNPRRLQRLRARIKKQETTQVQADHHSLPASTNGITANLEEAVQSGKDFTNGPLAADLEANDDDYLAENHIKKGKKKGALSRFAEKKSLTSSSESLREGPAQQNLQKTVEHGSDNESLNSENSPIESPSPQDNTNGPEHQPFEAKVRTPEIKPGQQEVLSKTTIVQISTTGVKAKNLQDITAAPDFGSRAVVQDARISTPELKDRNQKSIPMTKVVSGTQDVRTKNLGTVSRTPEVKNKNKELLAVTTEVLSTTPHIKTITPEMKSSNSDTPLTGASPEISTVTSNPAIFQRATVPSAFASPATISVPLRSSVSREIPLKAQSNVAALAQSPKVIAKLIQSAEQLDDSDAEEVKKKYKDCLADDKSDDEQAEENDDHGHDDHDDDNYDVSLLSDSSRSISNSASSSTSQTTTPQKQKKAFYSLPNLDSQGSLDRMNPRSELTNLDFSRPASSTLSTTSSSSGLRTLRIAKARHSNFLHGQINSQDGLLGATELEAVFPNRVIQILVGTWNMAEQKNIPTDAKDFVLPTELEFVPDVIAITVQESALGRRDWEVHMQQIIGANHVLYHSALHGSLHMAIFIRREIIWFCSIAEDDTVTTRFFKQIKTKGAVAISFTLFGTSFLFIGSHFRAHEGEERAKVRIQEFMEINKTLALPMAVIENPHQQMAETVSDRFDCVFWAGDLNFRIRLRPEEAAKILSEIDSPSKYSKLLENDELMQAMNRGVVFQNFHEGRITFPPTYKFDFGTDQYDTSPKCRTPSYTDRIMFKSKKKNQIECHAYHSAGSVMSSDHKPVYGMYRATLHPGRDTIPLSGGMFNREVFVEGMKQRMLQQSVIKEFKSTSSLAQKSNICALQ